MNTREIIEKLLSSAERLHSYCDRGETICFDNYHDEDSAVEIKKDIDAAKAFLSSLPTQGTVKSAEDSPTMYTLTHPGLGWIIPNASTTRFYLPCMSDKIDGMKWYASKDEAFARADKYNNRQLEYDESESSQLPPNNEAMAPQSEK